MKIIDKIKEKISFEMLIMSCISFLIGITVGFMISPVKKGITIGSYNGCNNKVMDSNKVEKKTKRI